MSLRSHVVLCSCLLLVTSGAPTIVGASGNQLAIQDISYTGEAVIDGEYDSTHLWQSDPHNLSISLYTGNKTGIYTVCTSLRRPTNNSTQLPACKDVSLSPNSTRQVNFSFNRIPKNITGNTTVRTTISNSSDNTSIAEQTTEIVVLTKSGDIDDDGLTNEAELERGTAVNGSDTDEDGLTDEEEVDEYQTDPTQADTDDDGLRDSEEISAGTDPTDPDTDDDSLKDGRENELGTNASKADTDGDGLTDIFELNLGTNPTNPDSDNDGLADGREVELRTDPLAVDTDSDGLDDSTEIQIGTDPTDADTDNDGLDDGFEHQFGTSATNPFVAGGLYLGFALLLAGTVLMYQRSSTDEVPPVSDNQQYDSNSDMPSPSPSEEVVTDSDRVLKLLHENDARLSQGEIIKQTEWSKSKVSRLLSKMEDNGQIEKITIGRENIILLANTELD